MPRLAWKLWQPAFGIGRAHRRTTVPVRPPRSSRCPYTTLVRSRPSAPRAPPARGGAWRGSPRRCRGWRGSCGSPRSGSEEHTAELQSPFDPRDLPAVPTRRSSDLDLRHRELLRLVAVLGEEVLVDAAVVVEVVTARV